MGRVVHGALSPPGIEAGAPRANWMTETNFFSQPLGRFWARLTALLRVGLTEQPIAEDDALDDEDIEAMFNAHISTHLAALPRAYVALVPPDLADLIRQAKAFHALIDTRGAEQEAESAHADIGFYPRHHVRLRMGPNADQYMAIPTVLKCEYGDGLDATVERLQIKREGAVVVDVFGHRILRRYREES
jgi:hypothetical protein